MVAAAADSYGGTAAADTVNQLRSDGYNAELNLDGTPPVDAYVVRLIALTISTNGRSAFRGFLQAFVASRRHTA